MSIYYITFYDTFSGVYKSQVIDVVKLYQKNNIDMKLIAFLSIRHYREHSRKIKQYLPDAIVVPSLPKQKNWEMNKWILKLIIKGNDNIAIGRGLMAVNLCLKLRDEFSKIIYDGRGAIFAETKEYGINQSIERKNMVKILESEAVSKSDYRIAVSDRLVQYWQEMYSYKRGQEVVIPCSLGEVLKQKNTDPDFSLLSGLKSEDILLIFSGSVAGWQSLESLSICLEAFLVSNKHIKILFLSKEQTTIKHLSKKYPDRIYRRWVKPEEVNEYLKLGDYGLLIREESITNKVASPVKFAEYLAAGLNVLISPNIGDYSDFVIEHKCGCIINNTDTIQLSKTSEVQKTFNKNLAKKYFSKSSPMIEDKYLEIISKDRKK